jgi:antitoxin (DNA-binding transcriptional repressor) of toxin-antitoxin stability system
MRTVTVEEAQRDLSRLLGEASRGEALLIAEDGRPVGLLLSTRPVSDRDARRLGFAPEKRTIPDDFDTMAQDEIIAMFEGEG